MMGNERRNEMEKNIKGLLENMGFRPIEPDGEFRFHCTMCGKCCIHREDILLNPQDIFRMAKELKLSVGGFMMRYCECYIGEDSKIPLMRLKPVGSVKRCPLLKNRKCMVHDAKPVVCAMFPIGRCIVMGLEAEGREEGSGIQYVINQTSCGDRSETHKVRDWLQSFGVPLEDSFFLKWQEVVFEMGAAFRKAETCVGDQIMEMLWQTATEALYANYDTEKEFLPQFEKNAQSLLEMLGKAFLEG